MLQWVKIGDFGISQNVTKGGHGDNILSASTPGYEAPEFLCGERSSDPHAMDMWSLGIVLQYALTHKEPETYHTQASMSDFTDDRVQQDDLEKRGISQQGIRFLRKLLSTNPSERPGPTQALQDQWICEDREAADRLLCLQGFPSGEREKESARTLLSAIRKGNKYAIYLAITQDLDLRVPIEDDMAPLHCAIEAGNLDAVKYFAEMGASLEQPTTSPSAQTPLHLAVCFGRVEILRYLIAQGLSLESVSGESRTPLGCFQSDQCKECVQVLLDNGANIEAAPYTTARFGQGLDINQPRNSFLEKRYRPLHHAAFLGLPEITKVLLERDAEVHATTKDGETALHIASDKGHLEVVKLLIRFEAFIEARNNFGNTPLMVSNDAARSAVDFLLAHGADIEASNDESFRPLHYAAYNNCPEVARLLLQNRALVDVQSQWGHTPLHLATWSGASKLVELLLKYGASTEATDKDGFTPLGCFSDVSVSCVDVLIKHGASITAAGNEKKHTPLHLAAKAGNVHVTNSILAEAGSRYKRLSKDYYDAKCSKKDAKSQYKNDPNSQNKKRMSATKRMSDKIKKERDNALREFLEIVNTKSASKKTPLDYATQEQKTEVQEILTANSGCSGPYKDKIARDAVEIVQKMRESLRACKGCKSIILSSGWQCEICVPVSGSVQKTKGAYDLCHKCVAEGSRCPGGHQMYQKQAMAPINFEKAAPLAAIVGSPSSPPVEQFPLYPASPVSHSSPTTLPLANPLSSIPRTESSTTYHEIPVPKTAGTRSLDSGPGTYSDENPESRPPKPPRPGISQQNRGSLSSIKSSSSAVTVSSYASSSGGQEPVTSSLFLAVVEEYGPAISDTETESRTTVSRSRQSSFGALKRRFTGTTGHGDLG